MPWNIRFIPDKCDSISVNINNQYWVTWYRNQRDVRWILPPQWANLERIKVYGAVSPEGKNGKMQVYWNDTDKQDFDFDNDEDHDVSV